jgi:hypothetical protein
MNFRGRIRQAIRAGRSVESIDGEILGPAVGLSEEHRAALWLYAWHLSKAGARRADGALPTRGSVIAMDRSAPPAWSPSTAGTGGT